MAEATSQIAATTPAGAPLGFTHAAFHALVDRTSPRLFRLAARLTGNEADAQDILQDSYLRAFRALQSRPADPNSDLAAWLYAIVTHVAFNWMRDRKRARAREEASSPAAVTEGSAQPEAQIEARAALRQLSLWLAQLPPEQRVPLVLKELEGLSAKEVAAVLGISEGAVEQRLVRARETLRTKLQVKGAS